MTDSIGAMLEQQGVLSAEQAVPLPQAVSVDDFLKEKIDRPKPILEGSLDAGCKAMIIGPSKVRKSFFLLYLLISMASGMGSFLKWKIPEKRRVLAVQFEIPPYFYQQRCAGFIRSASIRAVDANLHVLNLRGVQLEDLNGHIMREALRLSADVIAIDPLYKILSDENSQQLMKDVLGGFDIICKETGAAVICTHHCTKGYAGDKQTIDRGAGSGVLQRDFDTGIFLTPHAESRDTLVVEQIARCHPPMDSFTAVYNCQTGLFEVGAAMPSVMSSVTARRNAGTAEITGDVLAGIFANGTLATEVFKETIRRNCGLSIRNAGLTINRLMKENKIAACREPREHGRTLIGTLEQVEKLKAEFAEQKNHGASSVKSGIGQTAGQPTYIS
ncbi:MAG TPA: hypothetical protein DCZ94_20065 [Lentisphaeria bacterium]|nr:MAG: hypothetical protein A2X48_14710 [Lentisphaerae bacterium GWF2_49_21]HBC89242.1 hypothetical protein [Lentisphaeria bacterium]